MFRGHRVMAKVTSKSVYHIREPGLLENLKRQTEIPPKGIESEKSIERRECYGMCRDGA